MKILVCRVCNDGRRKGTTRGSALTAPQRCDAAAADGNGCEGAQRRRRRRRRISLGNDCDDRRDDEIAIRQQPADERENRTCNEGGANCRGCESERYRSAEGVAEIAERPTGQKRVDPLHRRHRHGSERNGQQYERDAERPSGRLGRANAPASGGFTAEAESANGDDRRSHDRYADDEFAGIVAADVVERRVRDQVVGDDVDNDVCERRGRRSGGNHEPNEPAEDAAHAPPLLQRRSLLRCRTKSGL